MSEPWLDWQSIETFPRDGEAYLATDDRVEGGFPQVVCWEVIGRLSVPDADITYAPHFFTHWARIPSPPAANGETRDG
jgi:hypothetical protein